MSEKDENYYRDLCSKLYEKNKILSDEIVHLKDENTRHENKITILEEEASEHKKTIDKLLKLNTDLTVQISELKNSVSVLAAKSLRIKPNKKNQNKGDKKKQTASKHKRVGRKRPESYDEVDTADQTECDDCGSELSEPTDSYDRVITDVVPARVITRKIKRIRRYCPKCKKQVTAPIRDVLPNSRFGLRIMLLAVSLKMIGVSYMNIRNMFATLFKLEITEATINNMIIKVSKELGDQYQKMIDELKEGPNIHGDETSWRVNGINYWLWAFVGKYVTIYEIAKSRGADVPKRVLKGYKGTITSDSWSAWNKVGDRHQRCHLHYFREIKETIKYKRPSKEFLPFSRYLRRILYDSHQYKKGDVDAVKRLDRRIERLIDKPYNDKHCKRFVKRLKREKNMLFTFILTGTDYHNNTAERAIRPNVIIRKITNGHRSEDGASAHKVLMSIKQTCNMRKVNFQEYMLNYLNSTSKV